VYLSNVTGSTTRRDGVARCEDGHVRGVRLGFGIALCVVGFFTTVLGVVLLTLVGPDGRFTLETTAFSDTHALVFDAISVRDLPRTGGLAATLDLEVRSQDGAAFVGVGPTAEVGRYLDGVAFDRVVQVDWAGGVRTEEEVGARNPLPPADEPFWVVSDEGTDAAIEWLVEGGDWTVVIMNADGAAGVEVAGSASVTVPLLGPVGVALFVIGLAMLIAGILLTISGSRMPRGTATAPVSSAGSEGGSPPARPDTS
jgi:hypothetical protein